MCLPGAANFGGTTESSKHNFGSKHSKRFNQFKETFKEFSITVPRTASRTNHFLKEPAHKSGILNGSALSPVCYTLIRSCIKKSKKLFS